MIKHNQSQLEQVADNITRVKEYLSELGELQSTDKDIFWKALKKIIVKCKKAHTEKIMSTLGQKEMLHPECSHLEVKYLAGAINSYDEVLNVVDENQKVCDEAGVRLKELKDTFEKIKANIELQ